MRTASPGPVGGRTWTPVTVVNSGVAFALEMGLLAALCYWGIRTGGNLPVKILLAVGAPALAATVWGLFLAAGGPTFPLPTAATIALKLLVLGTAPLALAATGHPVLAWVFGGLTVVSVAVEYTVH
ncbi:YrdB family protein [Kitasatospora sp. NBC_00240]|uniref:YrdB family protein n=1 Tax=Kitasatospora sp. NBC_00240 TaxID=2903567 RepID=UPI0022580880|nr:YrdB family protein [Kitasatospora sp. NBC_00240]MCX5214802.1 YrdB family protein [Kitasatospora sp. NBC_00240]